MPFDYWIENELPKFFEEYENMNYVTNQKGERVIAIGGEESHARIKQVYNISFENCMKGLKTIDHCNAIGRVFFDEEFKDRMLNQMVHWDMVPPLTDEEVKNIIATAKWYYDFEKQGL